MRQVQIRKTSRTRRRRYDDTLLPLDPRDPDIVRAHRLLRGQSEPEPEPKPQR